MRDKSQAEIKSVGHASGVSPNVSLLLREEFGEGNDFMRAKDYCVSEPRLV